MKKGLLKGICATIGLAFVITGCGNSSSTTQSGTLPADSKATQAEAGTTTQASTTTPATTSPATTQAPEKVATLAETFNMFAKGSVSTEEIYVVGDIVIGKDGDVKPGIYDLEVTGGSGNIFGERKNYGMLFINYLGQTKDSEYRSYPSKVRLILFEGDTLQLSDISKVKFNAVGDVKPSTELKSGEYVVGRDILPGKYKLSTNLKMDPQFGNLGWDIEIYNDDTRQSRSVSLNPDSSDVAVKLSENEIIMLKFNFIDEGDPDDMVLKFEKLE